MKFSGSILLSVIGVMAHCLAPVSAFTITITSTSKAMTPRSLPTSSSSSSSSALYLELPRVDLPGPVTEQMDGLGLKNPNSLSAEEYRSYSGAAILGTLAFFLLPGGLITGLYSTVGSVLGVVVLDFIVSAILGGGGAIYVSLLDSETGATARQYGNDLLAKVKDVTGLSGTLRYDIPPAITNVMTGELGLMNPNDMSETDYDGYSGAAVAGTLLFFLLPGAILTGATDSLIALLSTIAGDFVLSALIGGGGLIFLSLRSDDLSKTVNDAGSKLLDTVDDLF